MDGGGWWRMMMVEDDESEGWKMMEDVWADDPSAQTS